MAVPILEGFAMPAFSVDRERNFFEDFHVIYDRTFPDAFTKMDELRYYLREADDLKKATRFRRANNGTGFWTNEFFDATEKYAKFVRKWAYGKYLETKHE